MRRRDWISAALLFVCTFLLYVQTLSFEFVDYDDDQYVTRNEVVQQGLSPHTVAWAFTTTHFANWLPVTWLSHLLDVTLFGLNAGGHHATSSLLHGVNAMLVFLVLRRMTGSWGRSLAVAMLFAAHPLRVESVAWIAERKDVLCGTFFLLTLLAYDAYVRRPGVARFVIVCACYALGLMSKTMIVTLPFLLLVLDVWPLRRVTQDRPLAKQFARLIAEKVPLVVLALVACAWTVKLQESGGAMILTSLTLGQRLANAAVSIPRYLAKTIWPTHLAVFYPHPGSWPAWQVAASVGLIFAITVAVIVLRRRMPYLTVGWFWFLGMLVPVAGIIQAGMQSIADRYTYLPGIGLTMAVVWLAPDVFTRRGNSRAAATATLVIVTLALAVTTWVHERVFANTFDLMSHAAEMTKDNWVAIGHVGSQLALRHDPVGAERHFAEAVRINPADADDWYNWGNLLLRGGRPDEAIERYKVAVSIDPNRAQIRLNLGTAYAMRGNFVAAEREFREAVRLKPNWPDALGSLGSALKNQGRTAEAFDYYSQTLRVDPNNARALRGIAELQAAAPASRPRP